MHKKLHNQKKSKNKVVWLILRKRGGGNKREVSARNTEVGGIARP